MNNWKEKLEQEFAMALAARERKNEGQARVCARRAAGIIIREYYARRGMAVSNPSAYDLLKQIATEPGLAPEARQAAEALSLRVTEEFKLPVDVDLLEQARHLSRLLLGE